MPYADKEIKKEYQRRYFQENKARLTAQAKEWREKHKGQYLKVSNEWRAKNPDKVKLSSSKKYAQNRDAILARNREWIKRNPEKRRAIVARYTSTPTHREYVERTRNHANKQRAERRAMMGDFYREYYRLYGCKSPRRVALFVKWEMCEKVCYICGETLHKEDIHFDHVLPIYYGGTNDIRNLMPTHSKCNKTKSNVLGYPAKRWDLVARCIKVSAASRTLRRTGTAE